MLSPTQLRPLITVIHALVATVSLMLMLVFIMVWLMPQETDMVASSAGQPAGEGLVVRATALAPKPISADALAGKETFTSYCTACHNANADKLIGPGLKGVRQRSPGEAWLQKWIRNSSAVVASGDPYATRIFNDYGKIQMASFTNLTDVQIKQVLDYIDAVN